MLFLYQCVVLSQFHNILNPLGGKHLSFETLLFSIPFLINLISLLSPPEDDYETFKICLIVIWAFSIENSLDVRSKLESMWIIMGIMDYLAGNEKPSNLSRYRFAVITCGLIQTLNLIRGWGGNTFYGLCPQVVQIEDAESGNVGDADAQVVAGSITDARVARDDEKSVDVTGNVGDADAQVVAGSSTEARVARDDEKSVNVTALLLKIVFEVLSGVSPADIDQLSNIPITWKSCVSNMEKVIHVLSEFHRLVPFEDHARKGADKILLSFYKKMQNDFSKTLHTGTEKEERADVNMLDSFARRFQEYLTKGNSLKSAAHVALKRVELIYYKDHSHKSRMENLLSVIYKDGDDQDQVHARVLQVYHYAASQKISHARQLFEDHVMQNIGQLDESFTVLVNRTQAYFGLHSMKSGHILEGNDLLSALSPDGSLKESLVPEDKRFPLHPEEFQRFSKVREFCSMTAEAINKHDGIGDISGILANINSHEVWKLVNSPTVAMDHLRKKLERKKK